LAGVGRRRKTPPPLFDFKSLLPRAKSDMMLTADLQFDGAVTDTREIEFVSGLLRKYADYITGYRVFPDDPDLKPKGLIVPGMFCLQVEFSGNAFGRAAMLRCRGEYQAGPR
jgi:hypothetical protein